MTVLDDYDRAQNEFPEMWVLGEVSSPKLSCFLKLCPMMQYPRLIAKILSRNFNDLARCLCSSRVLFVKKLTELGMGTEDYLKEHQNINSSLGGEGGKGGRSCYLFHLLLLPLSHFLHPGPAATESLHLLSHLSPWKLFPDLASFQSPYSFFPMWSLPGTPRWGWLLLL